MPMSCITIGILSSLINIHDTAPLEPEPERTTPKPTAPYKPIENVSPSGPCQGAGCSPGSNIVGPIVGAVCGALVGLLIVILIVWFCYRRRHQARLREIPIVAEVKSIEHPSLYTGAISTTDSASRLYGMSPLGNDSVSTHYYEKINYN